MKKLLTIALTIFLVFNISADDFSFDDIMGEEAGMSGETSSLSISGDASIPMRYYTGDMTDSDSYNLELLNKKDYDVEPELDLDISYTTDRAELRASLNVNEKDLSNNLFDELSVTWYGDKLTASIGYQSVVWGKGDKLHVVDLINPQDYSDFMNPDYLDRKIAQPMIDLKIPTSASGQLELVYVPTFQGNTYSTEGAWVLSDTQALMDVVTTAATNSSVAVYNATFAATGSSDAYASLAQTEFISEYSELDAYLPDTDSLAYGQFGAHYTKTLGAVDLGATYYFGRSRNPSYNASATSVDNVNLDYDIMQAIGFEAATVVAGFNLRGEGVAYLTEDRDGTDEEVINPSLNYVAGFDRNLPVHNVNLNLQFTGEYVLFHDKIENSSDVEYGNNETATRTLVKVSDSFNHEKINPEIVVLYGFEDQDGMVRPGVTIDADGYLSFKVSATTYFGNDDTMFGQFSDNDFIEVKASYSF